MRQAGRWAAMVAALLYMLFFAFYLVSRPNYAWDNLAYVAIALEYEGTPREQVHERTFAIFQDHAPKGAMDALTGNLTQEALASVTGTTAIGDFDFRKELATNSDKFLAQLPFFAIKPMYPALMALVNLFGVDLITSGMIISVLAYVGIGMVFYLWFVEWMPPLVALLVMALWALNPWLILQARNIGPDVVSLFAILLGAYLAFGYRDREHGPVLVGRPLAAAIVFAIAVAIRPENLLYATGFVFYLTVRHRLTPWGGGVMLAISFLIYFAITSIVGSYGWNTLMQYTFVSHTTALDQNHPQFGLYEYINFYLGRLDRIVMGQGEFPIFALVGLGGILLKLGFRPLWDKYVHLIVLAGLIGAARIVVLPTEAFRALAPCYMLVTVALIQACCMLQLRFMRADLPS
jgi:hypothetical protein